MTSFAFRAGATALAGYFTRPFREPLAAQAATFLSPVGGYASARVERFRFQELVSCTAAYSQVIGAEYGGDDKSGRATLSMAVVEGLNILDMVTADRVVGRLASESSLDQKVGEELVYLPIGSYFVNLRIAGIPVEMRARPELMSLDNGTRSAIERSDAMLQSKRGPTSGDQKPDDREPLRLPLFEPVGDGKIAGARVTSDHAIRIPGFGDIYLGEYVVGRDYRQLTMVRVEMHSPEAGRMSACALEGNGSTY